MSRTLITVKPYYYDILYTAQQWMLRCPHVELHPEWRCGRARILYNLVSDTLLNPLGERLFPVVFVNRVPLDNLTVNKWISEYSQFIYDDTSLTNFLQQLGAYNTKRNQVTYFQVHKWYLDFGDNWQRLLLANPKTPVNHIKRAVFKSMYEAMNSGLREILEAECSTP